MPNNPSRKWQGGDVSGERSIDLRNGIGTAIKVANASYDPGYAFNGTLRMVNETPADVIQGYALYGRAVGDPKTELPDKFGTSQEVEES